MVLFRQARYEGLRESRTIIVQGHRSEHWIDTYWDVDGDFLTTNDQQEAAPRFFLQSGVTLGAPASQPVVESFQDDGTSFFVQYQRDGSVAEEGAIRVGDTRGNWLDWGQEGTFWKWY